MHGFVIEYSSQEASNLTRVNHRLFGRICQQSYRGRKYNYYIPGLLDNVRFFRIKPCKYFLNKPIDIEFLKEIVPDVEIFEKNMEIDEDSLLTGRMFWHEKARKKGIRLVSKHGRRAYI